LHGKDYEEQRAIALEMSRNKVSRIYEEAKLYVNDAESRLLHGRPLEQILTWLDEISLGCILSNG
jgi:hypothetical protein